MLHGTEEPLIALAGHSRQHLFGSLEFFLCLPLLDLVNVQALILHILDDGAPGQRNPDAVAQTHQRASSEERKSDSQDGNTDGR